MRKFSAKLGAAVVFAAFLIATVAFAQQPPQYVGPSSQTLTGKEGYFKYQDDCVAAIRGSIWCTSEMIIEGGPSTKAPGPAADGEWVNPVYWIRGIGWTSCISMASGCFPIELLNCTGWSPEGGMGLVVKEGPAGEVRFDKIACTNARRAACCK